MFFRFAAALLLVVVVSMAQVVLEKESLRLRRSVSRQYYQTDELLELHAQLRLDIQKLTSPAQLTRQDLSSPAVAARRTETVRPSTAVRPPDDRERTAQVPETPSTEPLRRVTPHLPLLRWERPVNANGVLQ